MSVPRVEALRTSTLGYEIATPTELPGEAPSQPSPRGRSSTKGPSKTPQAPSQPSPRERSSTTGPSKTLLPHPNHYTPHPSLPKEEGESSNRLKHSRKELPPLGEGWGGASDGMAGWVDGIIILPFFATKSTKNIVFVSDFIIFFIIVRSEREIPLRPVVIPPGSGRSFIHTGAI